MKIIISLSIVLFLASCARSSGIVDASKVHSYFDGATYSGQFIFVNNDTFPGQKQYRVFEQGSDGFSPMSELRAKANYSARFFCSNKKGKPRVVVISEMTSKPPHILGNFPRYELVFSCYQQKEEPLYISNDNKEKLNKADKYQQLKVLKELLDSSVLTEEEFKKEKAEILN